MGTKETMKWIFGIFRIGLLAMGMTYFQENFRAHSIDKTRFFFLRWGNGIINSILNFFGGIFGMGSGTRYEVYEEEVEEEIVEEGGEEAVAAA